MAVHKPRKHDAAIGVNLFGRTRRSQVLHTPARANLLDNPVQNKDRAVLNYPEIAKVGAAPGAAGSAQRKQLPGPAH
jgi:hypothetical protein